MSNSTVGAVMACAARLSADVLPGIPTCPGTQENVMCMCVLLCVVRSWLRRFGRDVDCPDCILCNELNESVSITIGLCIDCSFSPIHSKASTKAVSSPAYIDVLSVMRLYILTSNSGMLTADDTLPSLVFEPSV